MEKHTFAYICAKEHENTHTKKRLQMTTFRRRLEQSRGDLDEGDFSGNNQLFFGLKHLYRGIINPQETAHV